MDSFVGVYELGDVEVGGDAGEDVGVFVGEVLLGHEKVDHFADGLFGGLREVIVHAHDDVVRRGFGAGPFEVQVFADDEAEDSGEGGLHGGDVDFAVSLSGVAVADFEERSFGVDRDVEGAAGDEFLVIEVAGVEPRRGAGDLAGVGRRCDAHAAEERGGAGFRCRGRSGRACAGGRAG